MNKKEELQTLLNEDVESKRRYFKKVVEAALGVDDIEVESLEVLDAFGGDRDSAGIVYIRARRSAADNQPIQVRALHQFGSRDGNSYEKTEAIYQSPMTEQSSEVSHEG